MSTTEGRVTKPTVTFSPEVIKGWPVARSRQRSAWDSPWPFLTLLAAMITAFAIVVMAMTLHRQQAQNSAVKQLTHQLVMEKRTNAEQSQTIIALADIAKAQGKTLDNMFDTQSAEYRILRKLMRVTAR